MRTQTMRYWLILTLAVCITFIAPGITRKKATPQDLFEHSAVVFEGAITAVGQLSEHVRVEVPTKATVVKVLKGKIKTGEVALGQSWSESS
ncbi:MAG: hypothetical protein ABFD92_05090 [Planctomycetaceae bacterium]|nr:hypothetical protein [Planctomycetaceae bacterium]